MAMRFTVERLGEFRSRNGICRRMYEGVYDAARGIGVKPQTIYDYLGGDTAALGPEKRKMLRVIDRTK